MAGEVVSLLPVPLASQCCLRARSASLSSAVYITLPLAPLSSRCILALYFHHLFSSGLSPVVSHLYYYLRGTSLTQTTSATLFVMSSVCGSPTKFNLDVLYDDVESFHCTCGFVTVEKQAYIEHVDVCFPNRIKSSMPGASHRSRGAKPLKKDSSSIFLSRNHSATHSSIRERNRRYTQTELDLGLPYRRTPTAPRIQSPPLSPTPTRTGPIPETRSISPASDATRQSSSEPPELSYSDGSDSSDDNPNSNTIHEQTTNSAPSTWVSAPERFSIPEPTPPPPKPNLFLRSPSPVKVEIIDSMPPVWDDLVLDERLLPSSPRESSPPCCPITLFLRRLGSDMDTLTPLFLQLGIADEHDLDFLSTRPVEEIHALFPLQSANGLHVNFMQREYIKEGFRLRRGMIDIPSPDCLPRAPPRVPSDVPADDPRQHTAIWSFLCGLHRPLTEHCQALLNDGVKDTEHIRRLAESPELQVELRRQCATSTSKLCALDWLYIQDGLARYRRLLENASLGFAGR